MKSNYKESASNRGLSETINFISGRMNKHINEIKRCKSFSARSPMEVEYIEQYNEEKINF